MAKPQIVNPNNNHLFFVDEPAPLNAVERMHARQPRGTISVSKNATMAPTKPAPAVPRATNIVLF